MRIHHLSSPGSGPEREDGLVMGVNTFGVLDGMSAPHAPKFPKKLYDGLTGGEAVVRLAERTIFEYSSLNTKLLTDVVFANTRVGRFLSKGQLVQGNDWYLDDKYALEDAGLLPGTYLALGKIQGLELAVVQNGDCFAIIGKKNGEVSVSSNRARWHDVKLTARMEQVQREVALEFLGSDLEALSEGEHDRVREEMWNRFCPELRATRHADVNNYQNVYGHSVLNGQDSFRGGLFTGSFLVEDVAVAIFVTDGFIPWSIMKSSDDQSIGKRLVVAYYKKGLEGLLTAARIEEKRASVTHHTSRAEATGVVLDFME